MPIDNLVRGSDNPIKLSLTEDGSPVAGVWDTLDIWIGSVNLNRTADGDGVTLDTSTGLLTIIPANLLPAEIADLAELSARRSYLVKIVITSALVDDGAVFGGAGSEKIIFMISDKPA